MHHFGRERLHALGEELFDPCVLPGLAEVLVEEVVDQFVQAHALGLGFVPAEVGKRDLLAQREHVHRMPPQHEVAGELGGVVLGPSRGAGRVAVADEQDLQVRDSGLEHTLPDAMAGTMRKLKIALYVLIGLFLVLQLVPAGRTNPPVTGDLEAPADVKAALVRCCYPVAFFVVRDTDTGRRKLNFSNWGEYRAVKRKSKASDCLDELNEGKMPLGPYLWIHTDAHPTAAELKALEKWIDSLPSED